MAKSRSLKDVKDYWNERPCNIWHSKKEIGTQEWAHEVEAKKYHVEPHIPVFADFGAWKGKKVLEIGSGVGTDTVNFARNGAIVTAVDLSDISLDITRKRLDTFGLTARLYNANVEKLSETVPVEEYDLAYSFGVLHHTPNPEAALQEIKKYMGPNSILKIMVYHKFSWKVLWIWARYGRFCPLSDLDGLVARYSEAQKGCPVTYTYTKKGVRKLLKDFVPIRMDVNHIFPYRIPEYKKNQYRMVWYFRWMPKWLFRFFEKSLGWHLCITAHFGGQTCLL